MDGIGEFFIGDVWGDVKEYGSAIVGCLCCLMCSGPVLLIIGVAVFVNSFTDTRLALINEYNADVDAWNTGYTLYVLFLFVFSHLIILSLQSRRKQHVSESKFHAASEYSDNREDSLTRCVPLKGTEVQSMDTQNTHVKHTKHTTHNAQRTQSTHFVRRFGGTPGTRAHVL